MPHLLLYDFFSSLRWKHNSRKIQLLDWLSCLKIYNFSYILLTTPACHAVEAGKDIETLSDLENKGTLRNSHHEEFDLGLWLPTGTRSEEKV